MIAWRHVLVAIFAFSRGSMIGSPARGEDLDTVEAEALVATKLQAGARLKVLGKYQELVGKQLMMFNCELPFYLPTQELIVKVLEFQAQKDNLLVTGKVAVSTTPSSAEVAEHRLGDLLLEVESLEAAPTDAEIFKAAIARATASPAANCLETLPDILRRLLALYRRHRNPEVLPLLGQTFLAILDCPQWTPQEKLVDAGIAKLMEIHKVARDTSLTIDLALRLEQKAPGHPGLRNVFLSLKCRRSKGKWVTYEDFKRAEGLVQHQGKWVSPREKDLLESMDAFRGVPVNRIFRKRTEREYQLLAAKGAIEEGMRPDEVQSAAGFPDRVERRGLAQQEFTQWCYGDKYYYFLGEVLVKLPR